MGKTIPGMRRFAKLVSGDDEYGIAVTACYIGQQIALLVVMQIPASLGQALGLNAQALHVLISRAKAELYDRLRAALESILSRDWPPREISTAELETAFVVYARKVLIGAAESMKAEHAEACLEQLRGPVTRSLIDWIEPGPERFENYSDLEPGGEWERHLDQAYSLFRRKHPPMLTPTAEAWAFRLGYVFRLRHQDCREPFRRKMESELQSAIIEIEPKLRGRLPVETKHSVPEALRRHGFRANAEEHRLVVAEVQRFGSDWRGHLPEICRALEELVPLPKQLNAPDVKTWTELAKVVQTLRKARQKLLDYLHYRVRWVRRTSKS
jgi:hypothetical protein